ncbi:MAG: hypothetical protein GXP13_05935 [Gammaproteobacteria bacterium]|nr:hypothetical protein [Gammaproteobacteria bacterium]
MFIVLMHANGVSNQIAVAQVIDVKTDVGGSKPISFASYFKTFNRVVQLDVQLTPLRG